MDHDPAPLPARRPAGRAPAAATPCRRASPGPGGSLGYAALDRRGRGLLLPFYWMVVSSLKTNNDVFTVPIKWLPDSVVWQNYVDIWQKSDMTTWLRNTLLLSVAVTFLQVLTGSFAAYGFAKVRFPGRNVLFLAYIGTIAVPWQSYMIPQFILMSKLRPVEHPVVDHRAAGVRRVRRVPDEAVLRDDPRGTQRGGPDRRLSEYGIYRRIMLPLSVPALASLALLTFVTTWNDYLGPLIYLRSPDLWTIQLGLSTFISQYNAEYALIMTGSVLSVLPIAVIFLLGQRYFVEGIATTGLKG